MNLDTPSIWVGTWAAYNNGILHGAWIDCTLGVDHIYDEINKILETCPEQGEEWSIFDASALPNFINNEFYHDTDNISAWAEALEVHGGIICELANELNLEDVQEVLEYHENHYYQSHRNFFAFATELFDETLAHDVPSHILNYIDYESFARDLEHDFFTIWFDGECHVWSHN